MQYRISLFIAILLCAVISGGAHGRSLTRVSGLLASLFFTLMYLDARALNRVEENLAGLLSNLPPGSRVAVALLDSASWRLNGLEHAGALACLGRCFDYGNYEPPSAQFRVRVTGPNDVVAGDVGVASEIRAGQHIVTPREVPLYTVCAPKQEDALGMAQGIARGNAQGEAHSQSQDDALFELRKLGAGETTCLVALPATNRF